MDPSLQTLHAFGGETLGKHRNGIRLKGWRIETRKCPILRAHQVQEWQKALDVFCLPEMVFGESVLELMHESSGLLLSFNAWDALKGWVDEKLPPVRIPAANLWLDRMKPKQELLLDYDYTFTTSYCGSERLLNPPSVAPAHSNAGPCEERIDWALLERRDPILFYDEVILYEDELADNGIALCSAKVRVMPGSWFVLFRFWLRVDGALIRLRDTRLFCALDSRIEAKDNLPRQVSPLPLVVRVRSSREATFASLAAMGISTDPSLFQDPNFAASSLPQGTMSYEKVAFKKDATEGAVR
eukprot:TRINITY_DN19919_c0_g1_i1.p1 TRINITY_DN19919_c0_g1~~TRINITY_DN19919_c0_g1_i1.p1  ORF type:complete len:299 (+),score=47.43 TRINITY_DN19919_c0_g1_i1:336-1232(+)